MLFNIELPKKLNKFNYFKKNEKGCRLYSYNGNLGNDNYIICDYPDLEIEKDFCVLNTTLETITRLQPNVDVNIGTDKIVAKSSKGKFSGKYVDSNLSIPTMDYQTSYPIDLSILVKAANFTSTNEKKPILTGVNLNGDEVIATDSFKLYKYHIGNGKSESITLSTSYIKLADALFDNKLTFADYNRNSICIKQDNLMLIGNLLDGNFPDVQKIFAGFDDITTPLEKNPILESIEIAKISGNVVVGKDKMFYATLDENKFICTGNETFEREINYNGGKITFNAGNLELALKSFESDNIKIQSKNGQLSCLTTEEKPNEKIILLGIKMI